MGFYTRIKKCMHVESSSSNSPITISLMYPCKHFSSGGLEFGCRMKGIVLFMTLLHRALVDICVF